ncbi:unnamed protein product [Bursaphelenchus xylophilus]|uniref:(pine wood nematode) hypothetical protein n=1 Tax=Bursaphelenchus xylophilus TaxID=6326 RepID=A0A1I7SV19_BURXY|nr:unnamed protein product [Bursaphelenchus xylophilus]CAG9100751.1 unnamed protein product [Bursaphelenchus xylophilus]
MPCFCVSRRNKDRTEEEEYIKPERQEERSVDEEKDNCESMKTDIWEKVDSKLRSYSFVSFSEKYDKDDFENNLLFKTADPTIIQKIFNFKGFSYLKVTEDKDNHETVFKLVSQLTPTSEFTYGIKSVPDLVMAFVFLNRLLENVDKQLIVDIDGYSKKIDWFTAETAKKAGKLLSESNSPIPFLLSITENVNALAMEQFAPFLKQIGKNLKRVSCGAENLSMLKGFQVDQLNLNARDDEKTPNIQALLEVNAKEIECRALSVAEFYEKSYPPQSRTESLECKIPLENEKADFIEKTFSNIARTFPNLKNCDLCDYVYVTKNTAVEKTVELIAANVNKALGRTSYSADIRAEILIRFEAGNQYEKVTKLLMKALPDFETRGYPDDADGFISGTFWHSTEKRNFHIEIFQATEAGALDDA